jgi:hypothetical protein
MSPVIISNPLPTELTALTAELVTKRDELINRASQVVIADLASLQIAEDLFRDIKKFTKDVNEGRLVITRQIDDMKKKIMAVEAQATQPLAEKETVLARSIADFRAEIARQEAERLRIAREKAEVEAKALREKAEAEHKEKMRLWNEEQAAKKKIADEEALLFGVDLSEEPAAAPMPQVVIPEIIIPQAAPVSILPKSSVKTVTRKVLNIYAVDALIADACKSGGKIHGKQVLLIDEKAVEALLKAGCPVPGARFDEITAVTASGR